jgi:glutamate formiminotransferase/formiminotetrahydrofolate cyclodeaminase
MEKQLIECVPNFSEGRDVEIIEKIAQEIRSVSGVRLLNVDPGKATNRTVMTFVGEPEAVIEAAFLAIKKASELIDMRSHKGEHPRMGATDVCPLIPIANIDMDETVNYAKKLAARIGSELAIPIYLYESAAQKPERKNLATIREGEYEGFAKKMTQEDWKPDFGPDIFNVRAGATVIGARDFLIAYNINLNTTSTRLANSIAFDVREMGRVKRKGHPITGEVEKDTEGNAIRIPGTLKSVKAIGWYIDEYRIAQISMNLTDINITPVHIAFDEVVKKAADRGIRVTGSEIVGMVPKRVLIEAAQYFLKKQRRSIGISEFELIETAIKSLGLNDISPFRPQEKVIEYMLEETDSQNLVSKSLKEFANTTASESPAPGGGSIAAYVGALGASLGTMVANLSANKRGWEDKIDVFSEWANKGQLIKDVLINLVDEDTNAFNKVMDAFGMAKDTETEKKARKEAIEAANINAAQVPLKVMETAFSAFGLLEEMALNGNPNSITDAGVGALCIRTGIESAWLNVMINIKGIQDADMKNTLLLQAKELLENALQKEKGIMEVVRKAVE